MTQDDIIRMARETGMISDSHAAGMISFLERFTALVAAAEREACAKVCENAAHSESGSELAWASRACAAAIRARSER